MFPDPIHRIPLQPLNDNLFEEKEVSLSVLRTDETDPLISGNKWFKLKYNLHEAQQQGCKTLLSFGGPYSNHLHALAAAGKKMGFKTIGIIRGEPHTPLNPTLVDVKAMGMHLHYINRKEYRLKHEPAFIQKLLTRLKTQACPGISEGVYIVPEGGTNTLAIKGAAEISEWIPESMDTVCVACGTGGTMAGLIYGLRHHSTQIIGFPALKGAQFLEQDINHLLRPLGMMSGDKHWYLQYDYHFGGFGKMTPELARFIIDFEDKHSIPLDPIYTAKMMYGIVELINNNYFPPHSQILAIHSGGLQGCRGMDAQLQQALAEQH